MTAALLGLYKSAGVDLVRQQIEAELPPSAAEYDIDSRGLIVWSDDALEAEAVYDLRQEGMLEPRPDYGHRERPLPMFARAQLLFCETPISRRRRVDIWEKDLPQRGHLADDLASLKLAPTKAALHGTDTVAAVTFRVFGRPGTMDNILLFISSAMTGESSNLRPRSKRN